MKCPETRDRFISLTALSMKGPPAEVPWAICLLVGLGLIAGPMVLAGPTGRGEESPSSTTEPAPESSEPPSQQPSQEPSTLTDEQIEVAFRAGCTRRHPIEHYRGFGSSHQEIGPLWLKKAGEKQSRGVILPPFLRIYLLGRSRGCRFFDPDEARELAAPETWVVLWRIWKSGSGSRAAAHKPTQVRHHFDNAFHAALWSRRRDEKIRVWFPDRWKETRSLVAGFADLQPKGSLFVDYDIEEGGQSYLKDSQILSMTFFPKKWWARAFGQELP